MRNQRQPGRHRAHDGYWVGLAIVWYIGIALVFAAIATRRFSRTT